MNPYFLWILGLILIFIEFYVPGAVMGIAGGLFIFIGLLLFALQSNSPWATLLYLLANVASVALLIKFALKRIKQAKPGFSIYSNHSQDGYVASSFDKQAIGKVGVVLSDLKPGGYILIEGEQHQAISQSGYITKGTEVLVLSGQEESLIVKPVN